MRRFVCVLLASLPLAGCREPLQCTSASVVERVNVKLDREMRENVRFPEPHEPERSSFVVDAIASTGARDGALACAADLRARLATSSSFAKAHGFPPWTGERALDRRVRFTAHAGAWDTYVEVLGLDPPSLAAATSAAAGKASP